MTANKHPHNAPPLKNEGPAHAANMGTGPNAIGAGSCKITDSTQTNGNEGSLRVYYVRPAFHAEDWHTPDDYRRYLTIIRLSDGKKQFILTEPGWQNSDDFAHPRFVLSEQEQERKNNTVYAVTPKGRARLTALKAIPKRKLTRKEHLELQVLEIVCNGGRHD